MTVLPEGERKTYMGHGLEIQELVSAPWGSLAWRTRIHRGQIEEEKKRP